MMEEFIAKGGPSARNVSDIRPEGKIRAKRG
jgi:hypothetical protein